MQFSRVTVKSNFQSRVGKESRCWNLISCTRLKSPLEDLIREQSSHENKWWFRVSIDIKKHRPNINKGVLPKACLVYWGTKSSVYNNSYFLLGLLEKNPVYISLSFYEGMATPGSVQRHRLKISSLRGTLRGLLTLSVVVSTNTTMQLSPFQPGKIPAHLQLQSEVNESGKQTNKQSNRAEMLVC